MKKIIKGIKAQKKLQKGIDKSVNLVKVTMGPMGKTVLLDQGTDMKVTKDGVSVLDEIELNDPVENLGTRMIKEVAKNTEKEAGDGPQPLYSKILTPEGFVKMEDVRVGDTICGSNLTFQKVLGVYDKGVQKVYKVCFSGGQIVECSGNHLWKVFSQNKNKIEILTTEAMLSSGKVKRVTNKGHFLYNYYVQNNVSEMREQDHILSPYLIGVLLGDGSLSGTGSVEISIGYSKKHILDKLELPQGISTIVKYYPNKNYIRVRLKGVTKSGKSIQNILDEIGLFRTKSSNKFIPSEYLFDSFQNRKKLLQGLLDTDGHINKRGLFEFSTVSVNLQSDFVQLCRSLGIDINISKYKNDKSKGAYSNSLIYRITQLKGYKNGLKIIDIIETNEIQEMMCIKVSNPDHLYITDDHVLTHNTTTSSILIQAILKEGLKSLGKCSNPNVLVKGIKHAAGEMVKYISENSIKVSGDVEKIRNIATISANNDQEIGDLIAEAFEKVGETGEITADLANGTDTYIKVSKGISIDRGYLSPYFQTDKSKKITELKEPLILLADEKISDPHVLLPILEQVANLNRSLLIITEDVQDVALDMLVLNFGKPAFMAAVKSPEFGELKSDIMEDLAVLTGATFINKEKGLSVRTATLEYLGQASKVEISQDQTLIIGGKGDSQKIEERKEVLKGQLSIAKSEMDIEKLENRLSKMSGGVATMYVGGQSENEVKEKLDRVIDSLLAVKSAIQEGIVAGGGSTFMRGARKLKLEHNDPDFNLGVSVLHNAIIEPLLVMLRNADYNEEDILKISDEIYNSKINGINIKTGEKGNMLQMGIIDPAKVQRVALENAVSVGSLILTLGGLQVDLDEEAGFPVPVKNTSLI